jgi:hypothetical protein
MDDLRALAVLYRTTRRSELAEKTVETRWTPAAGLRSQIF